MPRFPRPVRIGLALAGVAALVAAGIGLIPIARHWIEARHSSAGDREQEAAVAGTRVALVDGFQETLHVPDDVAMSLGITVAAVEGSLPPQPLELDGTLFLDTNSMVHVHSRFAGDVVEVGDLQIAPSVAESDSPESPHARTLQFGDRVRKGQTLAVVWSKDLGEKKSELVENLSRLRLSEEKLKRFEELLEKGSVAERTVRDAEREVESDTISVARAERTLRSWRLNEAEIDAIHAEARNIHERQGQRTAESDANWARVEVRAPVSGTIMEKNVAVGDYVASELDIFKLADLSRLDVLAHAYEEDLPALEQLPHHERNWTILLKANPKAESLHGRFDRIGNIIDPSQHTALLMGWVDNTSGKLRVGQFVAARIDLPAPPNEVAVPVGAVVDLDGRSYVFTRSSSDPGQFTRRRVFPVRRFESFVAIDCGPRPRSAGDTCEVDALKSGEWVVTTGGIQLTAELVALQAAAKVIVTANP
ncbi:MAG: HlyD family efflux transporter periplasmic adaptor subunit [Planctomycetaceae bacterium]|nr:HlyD family efflux transporter periplasmic adaptor subunit [Planctomycetaceae bacterium]